MAARSRIRCPLLTGLADGDIDQRPVHRRQRKPETVQLECLVGIVGTSRLPADDGDHDAWIFRLQLPLVPRAAVPTAQLWAPAPVSQGACQPWRRGVSGRPPAGAPARCWGTSSMPTSPTRRRGGEISIFASQSATPSSTRGVQNALSFGASASKALNRNAQAAVSVSYDTYTDAANATRQLFMIAPTYTYALNRSSQFEVGYTFAKNSDLTGTTLSNTLALDYTRTLTKHSRAALSYTFEHRSGSTGTAIANTLMFRYSKDMDILPP